MLFVTGHGSRVAMRTCVTTDRLCVRQRRRPMLMAMVRSGRVNGCRRYYGPDRLAFTSTRATRRSRHTFTSSEARTPPSSGSAPFASRAAAASGRSRFVRIQRLVEQHREALLRSWDAYFNE